VGSLEFYNVSEGTLALTRRELGERRTWSQVISGRFTTFGSGTVLPTTSLIVYDRFRQ
jgi:hypothetical protein